MRIPEFIIFILSLSLFPPYALAELDTPQIPTPVIRSLPLECTLITGRPERLCIIKTESPYGPYDEIAYYHLNSKGYAALLGSEGGGVGTFGGFEFSNGGKYMWLSWAEEGHPHFVFYRTDEFIENGTKANTLHVVGDYYFSEFIKFSDSGEVVYRLDTEESDIYQFCTSNGENAQVIINPNTSTKQCTIKFRLK